MNQMQKEMANGQTIADTCRKHNITFGKLCNTCKKYNRPQKQPNNHKYSFTKEKYITYNQGKYLLRKQIGKKERYFGRYETLEEAKTIRDYLTENGWTRHNLNEIRKELNIE